MNSTSRTDFLKDLFSAVDRYLTENDNPETPVIEYLDPDSLQSNLDFSIPESGLAETAVLRWIDSYLRYSVRSGHPQFFNQLYQGFNIAGFAGEVISALANTSMYTYEVAPVATLIEQHLIQHMGAAVGYDDPDGIFLPGGSNANMTAMLTARNHLFPDSRENGITGTLTVFVSDRAHYSFEKAANLTGIGINNIRKIATDTNGRILPMELDRAIEQSRARGESPFFVAATAGTTVLGAFDSIEELVPIAQRHGLWLHVDGALGGSALLSGRHRVLLKDAHLADSFAWNPHKTMGVPLICSALLLRRKGILAASSSCDHSDYLFHDEGSPDLGKKSMQCGRKVDALKLWLSWQYFGDRGYEDRIDRIFNLAAYAGRMVEKHPRLVLMAPVQSLTVCFQVVDPALDEAGTDRLNLQIRDYLLRNGKSMVNFATVSGRTALRIAFINPDIDESDVDRFFRYVEEAAESVAECV